MILYLKNSIGKTLSAFLCLFTFISLTPAHGAPSPPAFIFQGPAPQLPKTPNTQLGPNEGGAANVILQSPADANTLYMGTVNGGVWKTTNAGQTWVPLTDQIGSLSISSLVLDPTDPTGNTLVAGTGGTSSFAIWGVNGGIFRSTDGGQSWQNFYTTNGLPS